MGENIFASAAADPNDQTANYNTPLTPTQEAAFQKWAAANPRLGNTYDYDARGFWLSGAKSGDNGHGDDAWKKPNHPTFSDLSNYHGPYTPGGKWSQLQGGKWQFAPNASNPHYVGDEDLQAYWQRAEAPQGNRLVMPRPAPANMFPAQP